MKSFYEYLELLNEFIQSYIPPPKKLLGFPGSRQVPPKTPMGGGKKRKRWLNDDGDILEWDYQHGKIERYNPRGKHEGEFDPNTGGQTKPVDPTRKIVPSFIPRGNSMRTGRTGFELIWWPRGSSQLSGEMEINATEDEVRKVFGLPVSDYPGDCLEVGVRQLEWLKTKTKQNIDLVKNEYSVNIFSS
jgi:hypothetical protein